MIRAATVADAPAVARVFGATRALMTYLPVLHTADEDRAFFAEQLRLHATLVAEVDGVIVAFAIHGRDRLHQLHVAPRWQGRGLGAELLARVKLALPDGFDLWTFQANTGAQRFYARHGLTCVERTDGSRNEEHVPDARYAFHPQGR